MREITLKIPKDQRIGLLTVLKRLKDIQFIYQPWSQLYDISDAELIKKLEALDHAS